MSEAYHLSKPSIDFFKAACLYKCQEELDVCWDGEDMVAARGAFFGGDPRLVRQAVSHLDDRARVLLWHAMVAGSDGDGGRSIHMMRACGVGPHVDRATDRPSTSTLIVDSVIRLIASTGQATLMDPSGHVCDTAPAYS